MYVWMIDTLASQKCMEPYWSQHGGSKYGKTRSYFPRNLRTLTNGLQESLLVLLKALRLEPLQLERFGVLLNFLSDDKIT